MPTRGKRQNIFADDEEQQPNDAFNRAVEAAKHAAAPKEPTAQREAAAVAVAPAYTPPSAPAQPPAVQTTSVQAPTPAPVQPAAAQPAPVPTAPVREQPPSAPKAEKQKLDRAGTGYTKATHRIRNESFQALEDMKLILQRKYGFKRVLLEEIVEVALLGAKQDLDTHQEQSFLVQLLRVQKAPENQ